MSIVRLLEKRGADPTQPWGDSSPPPPGSSPFGGISGVSVSEQSAMQILTVQACVGILADAVSTLPFKAYEELPNGILRPTPGQTPPILLNPFSELTLQEYLAQGMVSMALRGNHFAAVVERDRRGFPLQLLPLHPDQVNVRRNTDTGDREYRINGQLQNSIDVFHVPALMMPGAIVGMNPIEYARTGFSLALATDRYAADFFQNSAIPSGVIEIEDDLNQTQTRELAEAWRASHQGLGKSHMPAVLTGGAKWATVSIAPDDAQFLQTRDANQHEIAMIFRIPEHMLGMQDRTSSWGTGVEQMSIGFVRYTLRAWTSRWEGAFSRIIPGNVVARFDFKGLLRGDTLQRFQAYTLARNGSWMTPNEIRADEGMEPAEGLDDFYAPMNFAPIDPATGIPVNAQPEGEMVPVAPDTP